MEWWAGIRLSEGVDREQEEALRNWGRKAELASQVGGLLNQGVGRWVGGWAGHGTPTVWESPLGAMLRHGVVPGACRHLVHSM